MHAQHCLPSMHINSLHAAHSPSTLATSHHSHLQHISKRVHSPKQFSTDWNNLPDNNTEVPLLIISPFPRNHTITTDIHAGLDPNIITFSLYSYRFTFT